MPDAAPVVGIVLAAGAGTRFGGPKALARDDRGAWLPRAVATLRAGGCAPVVVVLGAASDEAAALVEPGSALIVVARDWAGGVSASLRAGLDVARREHPDVVAVAIVPVDLPGLTAASVRRVVAGAHPATLRRPVHDGVPGHPVVIGADHFDALRASVRGDRGAGPYLRTHGVELIPGSADTVADVDHPSP